MKYILFVWIFNDDDRIVNIRLISLREIEWIEIFCLRMIESYRERDIPRSDLRSFW